MDLQLKVLSIMGILLVISYVISAVLDEMYDSKRLGDILGDIVIAQFVVYVLVQGAWLSIRIWNY